MYRNDEPKSAMPKRWLDGTIPLTIGVSAAVLAVAVAIASRGGERPEWTGTVKLISLFANVIAIDNVRDGEPRRARRLIAIAVAAIVATLLA